jgi:ankyrin repeat protein
VAAIQSLLESGADLYAPAERGRSALHTAAVYGRNESMCADLPSPCQTPFPPPRIHPPRETTR